MKMSMGRSSYQLYINPDHYIITVLTGVNVLYFEHWSQMHWIG